MSSSRDRRQSIEAVDKVTEVLIFVAKLVIWCFCYLTTVEYAVMAKRRQGQTVVRKREICNGTNCKITNDRFFKRVHSKTVKIYSTSFTASSQVVDDITAYGRVAHIVREPSLIPTIQWIIVSCRNNRSTSVENCFLLLYIQKEGSKLKIHTSRLKEKNTTLTSSHNRNNDIFLIYIVTKI